MKWKDTLPDLEPGEEPSLDAAAYWLACALGTDERGRQRRLALAAAHIRAVRKSLPVQDRREDYATTVTTGDSLLWVALMDVGVAGWRIAAKYPDLRFAAACLRQAEAALRTYWKQAQA